jgi:hypothetical protein
MRQHAWPRFSFEWCIEENEFIFVREHVLETLALGGEDYLGYWSRRRGNMLCAREGCARVGKGIHFDQNAKSRSRATKVDLERRYVAAPYVYNQNLVLLQSMQIA